MLLIEHVLLRCRAARDYRLACHCLSLGSWGLDLSRSDQSRRRLLALHLNLLLLGSQCEACISIWGRLRLLLLWLLYRFGTSHWWLPLLVITRWPRNWRGLSVYDLWVRLWLLLIKEGPQNFNVWLLLFRSLVGRVWVRLWFFVWAWRCSRQPRSLSDEIVPEVILFWLFMVASTACHTCSHLFVNVDL